MTLDFFTSSLYYKSSKNNVQEITRNINVEEYPDTKVSTKDINLNIVVNHIITIKGYIIIDTLRHDTIIYSKTHMSVITPMIIREVFNVHDSVSMMPINVIPVLYTDQLIIPPKSPWFRIISQPATWLYNLIRKILWKGKYTLKAKDKISWLVHGHKRSNNKPLIKSNTQEPDNDTADNNLNPDTLYTAPYSTQPDEEIDTSSEDVEFDTKVITKNSINDSLEQVIDSSGLRSNEHTVVENHINVPIEPLTEDTNRSDSLTKIRKASPNSRHLADNRKRIDSFINGQRWVGINKTHIILEFDGPYCLTTLISEKADIMPKYMYVVDSINSIFILTEIPSNPYTDTNDLVRLKFKLIPLKSSNTEWRIVVYKSVDQWTEREQVRLHRDY